MECYETIYNGLYFAFFVDFVDVNKVIIINSKRELYVIFGTKTRSKKEEPIRQQQQQQPFNGSLSGTIRASWYQKKAILWALQCR